MFEYNGIQIYDIGANDFCVIYESFESGKRLFSNKLINQELVDRIKKCDGHTLNFGVSYGGIILDLRELKKVSKEIIEE